MPKVIDLLGLPLPADQLVGIRVFCVPEYDPRYRGIRKDVLSTVINVNGEVDIIDAIEIGRGILVDEIAGSNSTPFGPTLTTCSVGALWPGPLQGGHDIQ